MEDIRATLWMFLLLIPLSFSQTDGDQHSVTTFPSLQTKDHDGTPRPTVTAGTSFPKVDTFGNCLIDTEMGLIAIGSAGGLLVCLLVAIVALACQVRVLQSRSYGPRTSRSNLDLVSSAGYWDQPEARGLVGPCDTSVVLEEEEEQSKMEMWQANVPEERDAAGEESEEIAGPVVPDPPSACNMLSSGSRDSCLEVPRDLEDMPLVV